MIPALRRPCLLLLAGAPLLVLAQAAAPPAPPAPTAVPAGAGEVALAPSRLEIPLDPGQSRTEVVNVISTGSGEGKVRLLASLGDWTLDPSGDIRFARPGSTPRSAVDWMIYSPVEFTVAAGDVHPIRVTVDVPKDARPGDYTAVLFVEERPQDIKTQPNRKQIRFHFRLAAIFYVMVNPLTRQGLLQGLEVDTARKPLAVIPKLKNQGNSHVRPVHSLEILDAAGKRVAEVPEAAPGPVLAGAEFLPSIAVPASLPPGQYTLKYRVDFKDGGKVIEGRKSFLIPE